MRCGRMRCGRMRCAGYTNKTNCGRYDGAAVTVLLFAAMQTPELRPISWQIGDEVTPLHEVGVGAIVRDQLGVTALLHDATGFEHDDAIGPANRR